MELEKAPLAVAIIGLTFLVMATMALFLNAFGNSIVADNSSSNSSLYITSPQTISPIGEGVSSFSAQVYNDTWLDMRYTNSTVTSTLFSLNGSTGYSVMVSVNLNSFGLANNAIYRTSDDKFGVYAPNPNGAYQCTFQNGTNSNIDSGGVNISGKGWVNLFCVVNSTSYLNFYVNNTLMKSVYMGTNISFPSNNILYIGWEGSGNRYFNGSIDNFKIFNYSLSQADVDALDVRYNFPKYSINDTLLPNGYSFIENDLINNISYANNILNTLYNSSNGFLTRADVCYNCSSGQIFITSLGTLISSFNGSLTISLGNTSNWSSQNIFLGGKDYNSNSSLRYQGITEDDLGNLYIGEYTSGNGNENYSYVYKSIDGGHTWTVTLNASAYGNMNSRHIHLVQFDTNNKCLYVTSGDWTSPRNVSASKLFRSCDYGSTWSLLLSAIDDAQYISFTQTNDGCRLFGTDVNFDNNIVKTCDDIHFNRVLNLSGIYEGVVHSMTKDNNGYIFASTVPQTKYDLSSIYGSFDNGNTWYRLRILNSTTANSGFRSLTKPINNNFMYYLNEMTGKEYLFNIINITPFLDLNLNENSGTTAYDSSGNGNNGIISGATWQNDGVLVSLTDGLDFSLNSETGVFSIVNPTYLYSYIIKTWVYYGDSKAKTVSRDGENVMGENTSLVGIILTMILIGLVIAVLVKIFVARNKV